MGFFYSFCRGSRALPMLSLFPICRPCGERESFQTRNLGSNYDIILCVGPAAPQSLRLATIRLNDRLFQESILFCGVG